MSEECGPAFECDHDDYELDILTGRATCCMCDHRWYVTDDTGVAEAASVDGEGSDGEGRRHSVTPDRREGFEPPGPSPLQASATTELKPCPFCWTTVTSRVGSSDEGDTFYIECGNSKCGARIEVLGEYQDEAIAAWNRRAPAPPASATTELKPCPFCGAEDHEYRADGDTWVVTCTSCGCAIWGDDSDEAMDAWNRRAAPTPPSEPQGHPDGIERGIRYALGTVTGHIITLRSSPADHAWNEALTRLQLRISSLNPMLMAVAARERPELTLAEIGDGYPAPTSQGHPDAKAWRKLKWRGTGRAHAAEDLAKFLAAGDRMAAELNRLAQEHERLCSENARLILRHSEDRAELSRLTAPGVRVVEKYSAREIAGQADSLDFIADNAALSESQQRSLRMGADIIRYITAQQGDKA